MSAFSPSRHIAATQQFELIVPSMMNMRRAGKGAARAVPAFARSFGGPRCLPAEAFCAGESAGTLRARSRARVLCPPYLLMPRYLQAFAGLMSSELIVPSMMKSP
jgi:hypothetical protein